MSAHSPSSAAQLRGFAYGLLGVLAFSITLPATRVAVGSFDPFFIGLGRELVAACLAAPLLFFTRQPWPTAAQRRSLWIVVAALIVGFPVLSAVAMRYADASHGAVVLGLLPLATAIAGFLRAHERPSFAFWCASAVGSCAVIIFALSSGGGRFRPADWALLGAVVASSLGYAEGARLGREMGGWQVISWAVVMGLPITIPAVSLLVWYHGLDATPAAWSGFAYVSAISAYLGFFPWYHGLTIGGVARVSQIQLLQPFLTLAFAAIFLGEAFSIYAVLATALVALSILVSRKAKILHGPARAAA